MKLHKIKNTELSVCSQEQMRAYKIAFNAYINYGSAADRKERGWTDEQTVEFAIDLCRKDFFPRFPKFTDFEAIENLLRAHLIDYCNHFFIAIDYSAIGKFFCF